MDEHNNGLSRSDRDLLIAVSTKVDQLGSDVKDIKLDLVSRMAKVETRLDTIDLYHAGINVARLEVLASWTENFKANYKFILFLGGLLLGTLGGLIDHILASWLKF